MAGWLFTNDSRSSSLPGTILGASIGGGSGGGGIDYASIGQAIRSRREREREAREVAARERRDEAERLALRAAMAEMQEQMSGDSRNSTLRKIDRWLTTNAGGLVSWYNSRQDDEEDRVGLVTDIVPRTVEGAWETVAGLPRMAIDLGHDVGKAVNEPLERLGITEGEDDEFASDDIVKAVIEDYKYRYVDPFREEGVGRDGLERFMERATDDPLAPMLDALALRAGAAGIAGRVGAQAARSGSVRGARIAGLERKAVKEVAEQFGLDADVATADEVVSYLQGANPNGRGNRAETIRGVDDEVLVPQRRTIQVGGDTVDAGMVARNPAIRNQQRLYDTISEQNVNLPLFGGGARHERLNSVRADTRAKRQATQTGLDSVGAELLRPRAMKALRKNPEAQVALINKLQGVENETDAARIAAKLDEVRAMDGSSVRVFGAARESVAKLAADARRGQWHPDMTRQTAAARSEEAAARAAEQVAAAEKLEARLAKLDESDAEEFTVGGGREVATVAHGPAPTKDRTTRFAPSFAGFSRGVDDGLARAAAEGIDLGDAVRAGVDEASRTPRRPKTTMDRDEYASYLEGRIESLRGNAAVNARRAEALGRVAEDGDIDFVFEQARAMEFAAKNRDLTIESLEQRQRVLTNLITDGLVPKHEKLVNSLVKMFRETGDEIGLILRDVQERLGLEPTDTTAARTLPQRQAGITDINEDVGWFPQQVRGGAVKSSVASFSGVSKPGSAKHRGGMSNELALNATNPENFVRQAKNIIEWDRNVTLHEAMRRTFKEWPADADLPAGYVDVSSDAVRKQLAMANDLLDEISVFVPDGLDMDAIRQRVLGGVDESIGEGRRLIAPKGVVDRYRREFASVERTRRQWLKMFDNVTGVWRFLTLNARIPWLVNNIVGQTVLMAMSHSTYANIRATWAYLGDPETRALIRRNSGGTTMQGATRQFTKETREMVGTDSFLTSRIQAGALRAGEFVEMIGNFQSAISDDWARRLSMVVELRPGAERLARAKGISKREAMEELLSNEQVMSRVEEAVLGDLINFSDLTPGERAVIRRMVPFYSWLKGMSKRTFAFGAQQPVKAAGWAALGREGFDRQVEDFGGPVPDYVIGSILGGETESGRRMSFVTQSANPLQTPIDVMNMVLAPTRNGTVAGENPLATLNPLIKVPLETFSDRDFFTGDSVVEPGDSTLETLIKRAAASTPYTQSLEKALTMTPERAENSLYRYTGTNEALKHLGVPYRELNMEKALEYGDQPRQYASVPIRPFDPNDTKGSGSSFVGPNGLLYYANPYGLPN